MGLLKIYATYATFVLLAQVSDDSVQADWRQTFADTVGTYHHFEWAVGTGEGKSDIMEFENVGMNGTVQVNGLGLGGLSICYITLRAWKLDGRCSEISVKAHALKGQQCVHCRLVVGDGYVTITRGESIGIFFEHAEEAEEEEVVKNFVKFINEVVWIVAIINSYLFRMMIPWTRMEMSSMENAPVHKSMRRVLNLLESFFLMLQLLYLRNRHVAYLFIGP